MTDMPEPDTAGDAVAFMISVASRVCRDVELLAAAWQVTPGDAVRRLIDHYHATTRAPSGADRLGVDDVAIHRVYAGVRIDAAYHRPTRSVRIIGHPLPGQHFASPSGARAGVVGAINPGIAPNGSGWDFWIVTATAKTLRSIRFALPGTFGTVAGRRPATTPAPARHAHRASYGVRPER